MYKYINDGNDKYNDKRDDKKDKDKKEPKIKIIIPKVPFIEIEEVEVLERIDNDSEDEEELEKNIYYEEVLTYIDLYTFLNRNGIIFLWEDLTMEVANKIIKLIICLYIRSDKNGALETISIFINCYKGSLLAARVLYNFLNAGAFLNINIETIGCGRVGGPGLYALLGGRPRFALPHCRFLISRPNIKLTHNHKIPFAEYFADAQRKFDICKDLENIFMEETGQPLEFIENKDHYMSAAEARDFGIIDEIISDFNFKNPVGETQENTDETKEGGTQNG
uniref:ATP-dependent Clp protease proteolytic subunit n=1 Tax=Hemitomes congestum TaxID=176246 RepID=A0A221SQV8_9ERIC|nr:ATP-dependent Clp protease proteolytic subunit [Hemitomes congestum]ASN78919.1 ATP-dependent Clp protease proteolytic subunit [Hemitomes congestum]